MELDFDTVRALSSPTRIAILRQVLEKESTTTQLSRDLEKSKSTVSSHLTTLTDAGLLERNKVEGRKRVTYHPTDKARTIVKGREKKVKFSLASSAVSAFAGVGLLGLGVLPRFFSGSSADSADSTQLYAQQRSGDMGAASSGDQGMSIMSKGMESAANASANMTESAANASVEAAKSAPEILQPENVFLFVGVAFLGTSALSFSYGWIMRKLG